MQQACTHPTILPPLPGTHDCMIHKMENTSMQFHKSRVFPTFGQ